MTVFNAIHLLGGLALFLYGMTVLGDGLERMSGGRLERMLEKVTGNVFTSVLFGAGVTAALQSSSATTVIIVGLVNAKIMRLRPAIGVIMGANIGTTITAHILRLADISSDNFWLTLIKPATLAPLVAVVGIVLLTAGRRKSQKEIGRALLGFAVLFTGMFAMEEAVYPLRELPEFAQLFATMTNPLIGVLVGAVVTAVIQSSSASVGILQALSSTGAITCSAAYPIILGQNIGTCITPILASIGASKGAKRTGVVHLSFNVIGTVIFLIGLYTLHGFFDFPFWDTPIDRGGIANFHTLFNVVVTTLFLPFTGVLEKLAYLIIPSDESERALPDVASELDDRFLVSSGLAIDHARDAVNTMGRLASENFAEAAKLFSKYDQRMVDAIHEAENVIDIYEDRLEAYLLELSRSHLSTAESAQVSEILYVMNEYERIGDYAINIVESARHLRETGASFSVQAQSEMGYVTEAVNEIIQLALGAFSGMDYETAQDVEPLEEVVDSMVDLLKDRHIERLRLGKCSVDAAFPFIETLSCLERIADHCSNVGVYIIGHQNGRTIIDRHEYVRKLHEGNNPRYLAQFARFEEKYLSRVSQEA